MIVTIEKNELVIRVPMTDPTLSGSGKTYLVATGNVKVPVNGKQVTVGLNAYYKA
jgi:hypothetical protein